MNIVIWTTTPWTLPANSRSPTIPLSATRSCGSAVRNNSSSPPCCFRPSPRNAAGRDYQIVRSLDGEHLKSVEYQHPFCVAPAKLFAGDNFVTNDTGTGFVHIAPGHGTDDYNLGRAQWPADLFARERRRRARLRTIFRSSSNSPLKCWANPHSPNTAKRRERSRAARTARPQSAVASENYHHSYPHCWRSKTPIIFRAMDQWFIKIDHVAANGEFAANYSGLVRLISARKVVNLSKLTIADDTSSRPCLRMSPISIALCRGQKIMQVVGSR